AGVSLSQTLSLPQHGLGLHPKTPPQCCALFPRSSVFVFQKHFRRFPGAILAFKNTFVASPTQFRVSKVLLRVPRRNFDFQKNFYCFPIAILGFKRTFAASPMRFRASKALLRLSRRNFGLQKYFRSCLCVFSPLKSAPEASPGAFSAFKSTLSQGVALLTEF
ncbi:MAG: hypothetical protein K2J14_03910, partial [Treponemataceae bacterium]|nr:hypothetical protein [Treponemataceae bacterium]